MSIQIFSQAYFHFKGVFNSSPLTPLPAENSFATHFVKHFSALWSPYLHRTTVFLADHVPPVLQWLLEAVQPRLPEPHTTSHVHRNQTHFAQWCQQGIGVRDLREPRCVRRERLRSEKQELMWFFSKLQLKRELVFLQLRRQLNEITSSFHKRL